MPEKFQLRTLFTPCYSFDFEPITNFLYTLHLIYMENDKNILITEAHNIAQKMKFSIKDFFRKNVVSKLKNVYKSMSIIITWEYTKQSNCSF